MSSLPSLFEFARALPVAVIATDVTGIVTAWSPYAETLYGWTADETVGTSVLDLTVGPTEQTVAEAIMGRLVKGEPWQGEFTATRQDGSPVDVHVIDVPLFDDDGAIAGIVGLSIDVSGARGSLATIIDSLRTDVFLGGRVRAHERRRMMAELEDDLGARLSEARELAASLPDRGADAEAAERLTALLRESEAALDAIRTRLAKPVDAETEPHRIAEDQLADIVVAAGLVARIYVREPLPIPSPALAELL
jgi:PAS domain S-box-containing protein